ncbi:MAG: mCpol domain-containing protein [bacterium]
MKNVQIDKLFVFGDGDNIRHKIESLRFENKLGELHNFSESLTTTISRLEKMVAADLGGEVLMAGGDDILFLIDKKSYEKRDIEQLMRVFRKETGCTISFGVGRNLEQAYMNLVKAKANGKNKIVDDEL